MAQAALPAQATAAADGPPAAAERRDFQIVPTLCLRQLPTAPLAAGTLIAGYAVAAGSGSRPLGGAVLVLGGTCCAVAWRRRRGMRTAVALAGVEFAAFALSHVLALAVGAWPSVLIVSALAALAAWFGADARESEVALAAPVAR